MDNNVGKHSAIEQNNIKPKKRKKGFLFWASLTVLLASLIALGIICAGYLEGRLMYGEISDDAFKDRDELSLVDMKVDWDRLLAINPDTVAWVYIPGTNVNYPVVHTNDNETYLKTTFKGYKSYISWGAIFVDCNNKHDLSDQNIITYGHNMNDGSMYQIFKEMSNSDVFNQHRHIYFLTPKGNYKLTSFTLVHVPATEKIIQTNFRNSADMKNYIDDKVNRCVVDVEGSIPNTLAMNKIFTFSTCDNSANNWRYICFAYVSESTVDGVAGLD